MTRNGRNPFLRLSNLPALPFNLRPKSTCFACTHFTHVSYVHTYNTFPCYMSEIPSLKVKFRTPIKRLRRYQTPLRTIYRILGLLWPPVLCGRYSSYNTCSQKIYEVCSTKYSLRRVYYY